jgi:acyl transferase domain-containing protein
VAESLTGGTTSILSARFSYFLNLKGPCVAIDTACSSALVAIAQACDSLILGGSDLALAGGVYVRVGPGMHVMTSKAGMLSRQGRCHTFDNRADGFVPGEGVGLFLLKRHAEAVRDGDPIHAVIRGWGVNHDGRTNGITAPSASSQTLLEKDVYARFQIDPRTISLVEAHGTATKLGDPIEVEALTDAFRSYTDQKRFCALGSVKSNVGHLMIAAAVPAVVKAILALQQRMLPPTLHFAAPNEHIDLENSPFYVNTECRDWNEAAGSRRRAAVSSFGFSGTNAHVVLEEHRTDSREDALSVPDGSAPALIVLSARTAARLAARVRQLLSALETGAITDADLANAAYTLQLGRAAFEHRLALAVISVDELRCKLVLYQAGEEVPGLHRGETSRRVASGQLSAASVTSYAISDAPHILQQWVHGGAVDWQRISEGQRPKPRRIRVPLYPFASERHWHINAADVDPTVQPSAQAPVPRTGGATAAAQSAMNDAISSPDPADRAGFVAPRTELERLIAGIWEAVLELPCVGVEDSFLELGGHSLNGVHVIKRIREEFGVELPMGALIDVHSTVAALAVVLVSELASQTDAQALGEQLQRMESA